MGCCSANIHTLTFNHRYFNSISIEDKEFYLYTSNGTPYSINDPITIVDGLTVNPLALALYNGSLQDFKAAKENFGAKIKSMINLLEKQGTSPFTILFKHGHLDLLKYFLPLYMLECDMKVGSIEELKKPLILTAVRHKHLNIVEFIHNYFLDVEPPCAFNIHSIDFTTGENAALIACKNCDLPMISFLHEQCGVDFHVTNNHCQNPLMLAGIGSKENPDSYDTVKYLLEKVQIKTSFNYENLVEEFDDPKIKDLIRESFLGLNNSFMSESELKISNITAIGKKAEEDMTLGDLQMLI